MQKGIIWNMVSLKNGKDIVLQESLSNNQDAISIDILNSLEDSELERTPGCKLSVIFILTGFSNIKIISVRVNKLSAVLEAPKGRNASAKMTVQFILGRDIIQVGIEFFLKKRHLNK